MNYGEAVSPAENTEPAARPPRRRLPPDDRRQALINAALKLFNTYPYDEVSVDDIAAEAGMSRPLVYHYYGGKAGVFIGALQQTGDDVVAAVAKAGMDDPDNWLTAGLGAFFDHIQANPIGLTALYRHGSLTGRENRQVLDEIGDRVLQADPVQPRPAGRLPGAAVRAARLDRHGGDDGARVAAPGRAAPARNSRSCCPSCCAPCSATAAWHDAATAAVLPRLPPVKRQLPLQHPVSSEVTRYGINQRRRIARRDVCTDHRGG